MQQNIMMNWSWARPEAGQWPIWRLLALVVLLCYPLMGSRYLPLGGGARYLSLVAAPLALVLLLRLPLAEMRRELVAALNWSLPFLPFVGVWLLIQAWHQYSPFDANPLSRLLLTALVFVGARQVGVRHRHLAWAAALGAVTYALIAGFEVFIEGRERAWGGVYENRFGQYAAWLTLLCLIHALRAGREGLRRPELAVLIVGAAAGLFAALLTGSRGALLALVVAVFVVLFRSFDWRRVLVLSAALLLALGVACCLYLPFEARIVEAVQEVTQYFSEPVFTATSLGVRLELARVALLAMAEHPWLGTGYTSLAGLYAAHPALGAMPEALQKVPGFHGDWFQAMGMGGGALLLGLLATVAGMAKSAWRDHYRISLLVCALVFGIGELFLCHKMGLSLLMVCWALYAAADQTERRCEP
mgnify:CR=1 FL=1